MAKARHNGTTATYHARPSSVLQQKQNQIVGNSAAPFKKHVPPPAPPIYRPAKQSKKVVQPMMLSQPKPSQHPSTPPVYRPQPTPKVLQRRMATAQPNTQGAARRLPQAPPVYRPQLVPKVLQRKMALPTQPAVGQRIKPPAAPPVYRPQPVPRVLQAKERPVGHAPNPGVGPRPGNVIQARMGFEFETDNRLEGFKPKDKAYVDTRFNMEADTGNHIEFVIKPQGRWSEFQHAFDEIGTIIQSLNHDANHNGEVVRNKSDGPKWQKDDIKITIKDDTWLAAMQTTEGVELSNVPDYLEQQLGYTNYGAHNQLEQDMSKQGLSNLSASVSGLVRLIIMYLRAFEDWDGSDSMDGPKATLTVMARTDFHSMYNSLNAQEKVEFTSLFKDGNAFKQDNPIKGATGRNMSERVIKKKYLHADKPKYQSGAYSSLLGGPTIQEWLESIVAGGWKGRAKDKMSSPEGWSGGAYSMGLYGMDDQNNSLALFEMRGSTGNDASMTPEAWSAYAYGEFFEAMRRDTTLVDDSQPPVQQVAPVQQAQQLIPVQPIPHHQIVPIPQQILSNINPPSN